MAIYAVGDLQGHLGPLEALLLRVGFDASRDRLWLVGDLVNRGPDSLAVLRFLSARRDHVSVVLGNHDLHALARWHGVRGPPESVPADDTLAELLAAPDAPALFGWLQQQPLVHEAAGCLMVHAGLPPGWSAEQVRSEAAEAHALLSGPEGRALLAACFIGAVGADGTRSSGARVPWSPELPPIPRAVATLRLLTRLRFVDGEGRPVGGAMAPEDAPAGALPWFMHPARPRGWRRIVFGHWAALGLHVTGDLAGLDSGYTWGGALTALRLDDGAVFQIGAPRGGAD